MSRLRLFASALSLLLLSCDGTEPPPDAQVTPDTGPPPTCEALPDFETGDDGAASPLEVPAGQSRAGRVGAAQLPEDRLNLAVWAEEDFVLTNGEVALLIEDTGLSDMYDRHGGRPVGVARVEGDRLVDAGDFNEILFGFGAFLVETEAVTVLNDGSDGEAAVIRATGPLGRLEFAGDLLADLLPGEDYSGLPGAMDYVMAPGSNAVDIVLHVGQPGTRPARVPFLVAAFFQHYRMPLWTDEGGFVRPDGEVPMVSFVDDAATSYAYFAPEGSTLAPIFEQSGVMVFSLGRSIVPGCSVAEIPLATLVLGGPGLGGLQTALGDYRGETLRTVTGRVENADGSPAPDARVHVRRADGRHFSRALPAEDGTFSLDVPDEGVSFYAHRLGTPVHGPVEVDAGADTVTLTLPAQGVLEVSVTDGDSLASIPARVQVVPVGGAPEVPADFGERNIRNGRAHVAFTTSGAVSLPVAPGEHDVYVSRGFEWELFTDRVTAVAGETTRVDVTLSRVVDTTGVMCADYHIHTHRSPDSPDSPELKLAGLIADGLEIPIRADHEWVNDFQPVIERMGLADYAFGIGGEELTTFAWGHFGVFPLVEDRSMQSGSAISWIGRLPPAVFADVRARPENPALIIHHPRSGGTFGGYFNAAGFDRDTATAVNADHWDEDFTLLEVFNDDSFDQARDSEVADWFALLNSGRRVFAVGSSDSHDIYGSPVGYPRTCLDLGVDDPRALDADTVRDVTNAGDSVISGGIYLDVVGPGGAGPGEEVSGAGDTASFELTVQAASWIRGAMQVEVIVDGVTTETIPIPDMGPDPLNPVLRLQTSGIEAPVAAEGSWVVFHVSAEGDLAPVHPGRRPFAVSNPIFLTR
ncbi:MAG: CehA/McbA family metallohydrolase [Sandaracinaceae bacterium]